MIDHLIPSQGQNGRGREVTLNDLLSLLSLCGSPGILRICLRTDATRQCHTISRITSPHAASWPGRHLRNQSCSFEKTDITCPDINRVLRYRFLGWVCLATEVGSALSRVLSSPQPHNKQRRHLQKKTLPSNSKLRAQASQRSGCVPAQTGKNISYLAHSCSPSGPGAKEASSSWTIGLCEIGS